MTPHGRWLLESPGQPGMNRTEIVNLIGKFSAHESQPRSAARRSRTGLAGNQATSPYINTRVTIQYGRRRRPCGWPGTTLVADRAWTASTSRQTVVRNCNVERSSLIGP